MGIARTMQIACLAPTAALAALAFGATPARAAEKEPVLSLSAYVVDFNQPAHATRGTLYLTIERWSTPEERDRLRDVLIKQGSDALLSALQKVKPRVGYVRTTRSLAWDLYYAHEVPTENGGRRIYLATDRPMGFWELRNQARSVDYGFTLAEIRLDKDGKGEGKLVPAAKVKYNKDKGHIEVENYEALPVQLTNVEVTVARGSKP